MKISSVRIENFRSFKDETIFFNDYSCMVGPNGSGKSSILQALNVFFRDTYSSRTSVNELYEEDFHKKNISEHIKITVIFVELSDEAKESFKDYYRQEQLVVSTIAEFSEASQSAPVKQYGQRMVMAAFSPFFKADKEGAKVGELKEIYASIQEDFSDLAPPGTKAAMVEALQDYEESHGDKCELQLSEDQFYGFSKGANRLAEHVQWIFVPAVKDASDEQNEGKDTALGKLLVRTVRAKTNFDETVPELRERMKEEYQKLLDGSQDILNEISASLEQRLTEWAHPGASLKLHWWQDPDKSVRVDMPGAQIIVGEGNFEGELTRFGHGFQRSYLLALLQELSGCEDDAGPTLILACEEPELYQHPPQARHLAHVLEKLSKSNSQIMVCTHHPLIVSGEGFENVRLVRKDDKHSYSHVSQMSFKKLGEAIAEASGELPGAPEGVLLKIHQTLQPNFSEIFFTHRLILVEGLEDVAYVTTYLNLMGQWDEYRRLGCHIVPVNGKDKLIPAVAIASRFDIPFIVIFDADSHAEKEEHLSKHEKDNLAIQRLCGIAEPTPFPDEHLWGGNIVMWTTEIGKAVSADFEAEKWSEYKNKTCAKFGNVGGAAKSTLFIADILVEAWNDGQKSPTLERLCNEIMKFAESS